MVSLPSWIFSKASNIFTSLVDEGEELARATLQEIADNNLTQYSIDSMHRVVVLGARDDVSIQWAQDAMEVLGLDRRIIAYCYVSSYVDGGRFKGVNAFDEISARNGALVTEYDPESTQIPVCCSPDVWKKLTEEQQRQVKCVIAYYPDDLPNKHLIKNLICQQCPRSPEFDLERLTCHDMEGGECKSKALTSNRIKNCLRYCTCSLHHEEIRTDKVEFICSRLDELLCKPSCGPGRTKILIAHTLRFTVEEGEDDEDDTLPSPEQFIEFFEKFKAQFEVLEYQCVMFDPDMFTRVWTDESIEQWSKIGKIDRYTAILPWSNRRPVIFNGVEMPFSENDLI